MPRALRSMLMLLVIAALVPPVSRTVAQEPALDVVFSSMSANATYPDGITFTLEFATDEPIERAELFYTSDGDDSLRLVTVPIDDPHASDLSYFLDLRIYYFPPGIDFIYQWRLTGADGATAQSEQSRAAWVDTRFDWTFIETQDVRIATYDGDADFAQAILDSAQGAIDRIQSDLGAELEQQVRVWAYASKEDFGGTRAPNSEQWSVGVAYPSLKVVLAVLPTGDINEVGRVIPHEISHQVIAQAMQNPFNRLPTWLDEGIAVAYQENGNSHFPGMVQEASDQGQLFSIRALNAGFPYDGAQATLGYAQSFSIVTFIRDTWGEEGLAELIAIYRQGVSHDEAATTVLGVDLDELDRLWKESIGYEGDRPVGSVDGGRSETFWGQMLSSGALLWMLVAGLALVVGLKSITSSRRKGGNSTDRDAFSITIAPR